MKDCGHIINAMLASGSQDTYRYCGHIINAMLASGSQDTYRYCGHIINAILLLASGSQDTYRYCGHIINVILLLLASGSQDTYAVGDISGKHNKWRQEQSFAELSGRRWDIYLPMYGHHSVAHRAFIFYR
jgi:hypothetical protein